MNPLRPITALIEMERAYWRQPIGTALVPSLGALILVDQFTDRPLSELPNIYLIPLVTLVFGWMLLCAAISIRLEIQSFRALQKQAKDNEAS